MKPAKTPDVSWHSDLAAGSGHTDRKIDLFHARSVRSFIEARTAAAEARRARIGRRQGKIDTDGCIRSIAAGRQDIAPCFCGLGFISDNQPGKALGIPDLPDALVDSAYS